MKRFDFGWRGAAIAINVLLVVAIPIYVLMKAFPSTEAARLRNALLIRSSAPADFDWAPGVWPEGFKVESRAADPAFARIVEETGAMRIDDDWGRARALASRLTPNTKDLGPIQEDLWTTYRRIVDRGEGYCVDFTTVFMALAHAAGIPVRQWSFSFDGFGGRGHTFNEIYDSRLRKWVFLDVYNNFYASDRASGKPLSALEFRDAVLKRRPMPDLVPLGPGRVAFATPERAEAYYRNGAPEWYLWWGNNVVSYDQHPVAKFLAPFSRAAAQFSAIALDVYPTIRILEVPENERQVGRMHRLGTGLLAAGVVWLALVALLVAQLRARWRDGTPPLPSAWTEPSDLTTRQVGPTR